MNLKEKKYNDNGSVSSVNRIVNETISPNPIRITDLKVERAKLKIQNLTVLQTGHLPGRTLVQKNASYFHWAFIYIVKGQGTYQVDNGEVKQLTAGNVVWEWPGAKFSFGPNRNEAWDEYYISFTGNRIQEWIATNIIQYGEVLHVGVDPKWLRKIETIADFIASGIPSNADRAALLLEALIYDFHVAHTKLNHVPKRTERSEFVLNILEHIAAGVYHPWNEQKIWEQHHISRSTLRRIVIQNTGYPINEYVNRLKINEAKKLLRLTEIQIKEISQMLGYQDPAYFSRLFKKYTNLSATQYRTKMFGIRVEQSDENERFS